MFYRNGVTKKRNLWMTGEQRMTRFSGGQRYLYDDDGTTRFGIGVNSGWSRRTFTPPRCETRWRSSTASYSGRGTCGRECMPSARTVTGGAASAQGASPCLPRSPGLARESASRLSPSSVSTESVMDPLGDPASEIVDLTDETDEESMTSEDVKELDRLLELEVGRWRAAQPAPCQTVRQLEQTLTTKERCQASTEDPGPSERRSIADEVDHSTLSC